MEKIIKVYWEILKEDQMNGNTVFLARKTYCWKDTNLLQADQQIQYNYKR